MSFGILEMLLSFGLLIVAMSIHEFSHGWVAYKLGDYTAKFSGRLTLNPLAHIDPMGTIILPLLLFISTGGRFVIGYAKPVPVNFSALHNPKRDIIWVGLAGPLVNLLFAFLLSFLLRIIRVPNPVYDIVVYLVVINVILGVFNLMPIPPLDGSRVLMGILPADLAIRYAAIEPFGFFIIMLLVFAGAFRMIIVPIAQLLLNLMGIVY